MLLFISDHLFVQCSLLKYGEKNKVTLIVFDWFYAYGIVGTLGTASSHNHLNPDGSAPAPYSLTFNYGCCDNARWLMGKLN